MMDNFIGFCTQLPDIDPSTVANDLRPSTSFSARKSSMYSSEYTSVFGPAASYLAAPPSPRHEGNVGQAPKLHGTALVC